MKILTIVGARPQFIKAAALSRELGLRSGVEEVIVHTGQHFDANMSDVFFTEMDLPKPKHNLHIHSLGHGAMTGRMMEGIEGLLMTEKPNLLLVYGDTNSTIAGALAAKKLHIPVGHVEAGLRSFNMKMPEEVNRILTDRISDHLFCPTQTAVDNLMREGFEGFDCQIHRSGDVMQDAAMYYARTSAERSKVIAEQELEAGFVLATIHRAENTDDPERLGGIIQALNEINRERRVICPLHPRTRNLLEKQGVKPEFTVLDPVGYFDMIELLKAASMVMTDSGGLQKEAYFFQNPCVTMRDETEWTELVDHGYNVTVGADKERILGAYAQMKNASLDFSNDLYGGGKAAAAIADVLQGLE
ncbi:MAG: UDP-N-acetylglucosamine 2-epimerase (non-hydrolyzing) [Flavobacteriales bacterium]|nr:UDP-N-acetylglucosamine 2-epimerase (non-hydrolyzing) [Flavobacteriales bacterium]